MTPVPFPGPRPHGLRPEYPGLRETLSLRAAVDGDLPALRRLYATTRDDELANVPWPQAMKDQFIDQQFDLQHRHYLGHYADADYLVLDSPEGLAGRFYRWRAPEGAPAEACDLVIDICLMPWWRGKGVGGALLRAAMAQAASRGRGMSLQVLAGNLRAQRLYERLGFALSGEAGMHVGMHWATPGPTAPVQAKTAS